MNNEDMKLKQDLAQNLAPNQQKLKKQFLAGAISPDEFREEITRLDQSGTHTEEAGNNIALLEDPEVKGKIFEMTKKSKGVLDYYFSMLSLSYFHKGQRDLELKDFQMALKNAEKVNWENYRYWFLYVAGTVAYFAKRKDVLDKAIKELSGLHKKWEVEHKNDDIIENRKRSDYINLEILKRLLSSLGKGDEPKEKYNKVYGIKVN